MGGRGREGREGYPPIGESASASGHTLLKNSALCLLFVVVAERRCTQLSGVVDRTFPVTVAHFRCGMRYVLSATLVFLSSDHV